MRKHLALLALAATACQQQPPATQAATAAPIAAAVPFPAKAQAAVPPAQVVVADSLTPEMRAMLRQVNLANLYLAPDESTASGVQTTLDGFVGQDPQRLSLALLRVTRDSLKPQVFHLVGKTRFQNHIADFTGELRISRITDFYDQETLLTQNDDSFVQDTTSNGFPKGQILNARAYSATANFRFISSGSALPFLLTGRAMLDFWLNNSGKTGLLYAPCEGCIDNKAPAKGSGLLLRGTWLTANSKPFVVSRDAFFIAPAIIQDFGIGDRGAEVNPKYAKLGWSNYWENDEWWADSPTPSL